jgi:hypothetical protein
MQNAALLDVVMLRVIALVVIMLSVVMPNAKVCFIHFVFILVDVMQLQGAKHLPLHEFKGLTETLNKIVLISNSLRRP